MESKYRVEITWSPEDQVFIARVPELKGCVTHGDNPTHAVEMAQEAIQLYLESLKDRGLKVPPPLAERSYSGKLVVRLPKTLHRDLAIQAQIDGVSLNTLIERKLSI